MFGPVVCASSKNRMFQFSNPLFLGFVLAGAIPIVIHLFSKRRYNEVDWAAMHFLMAAIQKKSRRLTLESLILLLLRTAMLILLGLAMASPIYQQDPNRPLPKTQSNTLHVFAIDASYSMGYQFDESTLFDLAKRKADQIIDAAPTGDAFVVVSLASPSRAIVSQPMFDAQSAKAEIEKVELTHQHAEFQTALSEFESLYDRARTEYPQLSAAKIHILSDFSKNSWAKLDDPQIKNRISKLESSCTFNSIQIGPSNRSNVAITSIDQSPSLVTIGQVVEYRIQVNGFSLDQDQSKEVTFFVNDKPIQKRSITVSNSRSSSLTFTHRFENEGDYSVVFRISSDQLPVDNSRFLATAVRANIETLLLYGRQGDEKFLQLALNPSPKERGSIRTESRSLAAMSELRLAKYDSIYICNPSGFSENEYQQLYQYVEKGGSAIICLGGLARSQGLNILLNNEKNPNGLFYGEFLGESEYQKVALDPMEFQHPILSSFRGIRGSGLRTTPVWKYFRFQPATSRTRYSEDVAVSLDSGDPAIFASQVSRGRVVMITIPCFENVDESNNQPWSAFHLWPSFPPLIQDVNNWSLSEKVRLQNFLVGDNLEGPVESSLRQKTLLIRDPEKKTRETATSTEYRGQVWFAGRAESVGIYEIFEQEDGQTIRLLSANLDTAGESDVSQVDPETLPFENKVEKDSASALGEDYQQKTTLPFQYLLSIILLLLVFETSFAWWIGKG